SRVTATRSIPLRPPSTPTLFPYTPLFRSRHLLPVHVIEELTLGPDGVIGDLHRVNRADGNRTIMTGVPLPGPLKRERGRGGSDRTGSEPTPVPGAHANRGEHRPEPGTHDR